MKIKSIIAILCAAVIGASVLAACSNSNSSKSEESSKAASTADNSKAEETEAASDSDLADFGWVKFKMPEGYEDLKESASYITIGDAADSHKKVKIFNKTILSGDTVESIAEKTITDPERYQRGDDFEMGDYKWITINFTFNDKPSRHFYTQINDKKCMYLTVYEQTQDDAAVKTILESIKADASKLS